ncbi:hypothetical protein BACINT_03144 [Bacteroides intestinalis DSM 17393]|uniref:Uncharacterized protein n=1 Tax=Bacteroides intestinalis DSM 17393 TaxID=471870 RepID=B3CI58_9BACE|nr:hypothetical protein BACINT_03144 [Bacteroides intestinalis DSM 17393]
MVDGSVLLVQPIPDAFRQKVGIDFAEKVEADLAVLIQPFAIVVQCTGDAGEIEIEHKISVTTRCGMLPDVEVAKEVVELVAGTHIVVMLQHVQRQALPETARTDEEEKAVRLLYHGDEAGFVHVIIVFTADDREVHHAVGKSLSAGY